MQEIVRVQGLSKFSKSRRPILDKVSFVLKKGESLAIKGPSGCGKSTLAKILSGLTKYDEGRIDLFGVPLFDWLKKHSFEFRQKIQLVFQHPSSAFSPQFPVKSYFEDAWKSHHGNISQAYEDRVSTLFSRISFSSDILSSFPHELSGGELQRIAILRALLLKPDLIICDEITSNLDMRNQVAIMSLLEDLRKTRKVSLIIISHNATILPNIIDRVLMLS